MQDEKTNDLKFALAKACTPLLDVGKTRTYDDDMFKLYPEDLHGLVHARKCKGNLLKLASLVNDKISTVREILTIYEHDASVKDPSDRSPIFEIAVKLYAKIGDDSIIADFFNFDGIADTVGNRQVFQDAVQSLNNKTPSMSRKAHSVPAEATIAKGRVAAAAGGRKKEKEKNA
jgi:hypothetical protein